MEEKKDETFIDKFLVLKGAVRELWLILGTKILAIVAYGLVNSTLVLWLSSDLKYGDVSAGVLIAGNKRANTVSIVDLASGRSLAELPTPPGPHESAVSSDGRWGVITGYGTQQAGNTLLILDLSTHTAARTIDLGEYRRPHGIAYDEMETSFFLGRETVVPRVGADMPYWREALFAGLCRNARTAADFFGVLAILLSLPAGRWLKPNSFSTDVGLVPPDSSSCQKRVRASCPAALRASSCSQVRKPWLSHSRS